MKDIVEILTKNKETISTMESCTGGAIVNEITNIPGASEVLKCSVITYSNEYKMDNYIWKSQKISNKKSTGKNIDEVN